MTPLYLEGLILVSGGLQALNLVFHKERLSYTGTLGRLCVCEQKYHRRDQFDGKDVRHENQGQVL